MNTAKRTKLKGKHTVQILALALVCILTAAAIWMTHRGKGGIQIAGDTYYTGNFPLEGHFNYYRMDKKRAGNSLGGARDTMGSSGCLTRCVAASLKGQGTYDYTPGQSNQLSNDHGVYNESGAIIWKNLEEVLLGVTVDLDGQMSSAFIDRMIEQEKYPVAKVRRKNGAVHWIMLTGTEEDFYDITAMDLIDGYVHLGDYVNTIYSVRVVAGGFYWLSHRLSPVIIVWKTAVKDRLLPED